VFLDCDNQFLRGFFGTEAPQRKKKVCGFSVTHHFEANGKNKLKSCGNGEKEQKTVRALSI
jgi:hypothetical protein